MSTLEKRCSEALQSAEVAIARDPDGALRVVARSVEVGDLVVAFDDNEITVFIGDLTHRHFTPGAEGNLDASDQVGECVREAVDFVQGVLNDRWMIWTYPNGAGGCYRLGDENNPMADAPISEDGTRYYLWSGPRIGDSTA